MSKSLIKGPSVEELDAIEMADYGNLSKITHGGADSCGLRTPEECHATCHSTQHASGTPRDLESRTPSTPAPIAVAGVSPSFFYPAMNRWRVLAACLIYFGNGMSDSAPGALIPYIENYYSIGYAVVSLIWIGNAVGFISCAVCTETISGRLGRARSLMLSEAMMSAAYVIIACSPPFPVVVVAYLIMGFGNALNLALNNVFCANLSDSTVILGLAHGSYGVGGIVAPIAATSIVSNGIFWARFYLIPLGIRCFCFFYAGWAFWNYENEGTTHFANSLQHIPGRQATAELGKTGRLGMLGRALKNTTTLVGALYIFAYQGGEVSESGWFVSYLIDYRKGNPAKVGYVSSGFWAGITVGRFTLTHLAHTLGEKRCVVAMTLGAIAFQLMAWLIPNVIGNAVSVAIVGLLLGPVYPCAMTIFTKLIPGNLQVIAIGFIASAGSSGGAIVPFLTGLIAQSAGTFVLHPICISFFTLMLCCWAVLPRVAKRND